MRVISGNDKRAFPRQKTPEAFIRPTLLVDGRRYHAQCTDLSFGGARFELNSKIPLINGSPVQFTLQDTSFDGVLSWNQLDTRSTKLGIKLELPKPSNAFASDDPDWDLIEEKETLESIFQGLAFKGPEAPLTIKQVSGHAILLVDRYVPGEYFEAEIFEATHGHLSQGSFCGEFSIFQTFNSFQSQILELDTRNRIRFSIPNSLARILRRETVRVRTMDLSNPPSLQWKTFIHPQENHAIDLWDFSEQGFSILDRDGKFSLPKGYSFGLTHIRLPNGGVVKGNAQITSYRWIEHAKANLVGFHFQPDEDSRTIWHNAALKGRYPTLKFDYQSQDHKEIWNLFERSGYLNLKDREAFAQTFDSTRNTWSQLEMAGTNLSKRALIKSGDDVVGHLQMDRIYPRTWCAHHLAIDPSVSKIVGKEIYAVTADVLSAESAQYILSLTEASKPWNQRNYYNFIRNYRFSNENETKMFQVFEADTRKNFRFEVDPEVKITPANQWDHQRILRYFELFSSNLEREACGLVKDDLDLSSLNNSLRLFGLKRAREFLVAKMGETFLGFSRIETGSPGVNIFGLLDMLYVHVHPDFHHKRTEIQGALIDASLKRFFDLGVIDVIVALDDNKTDHYRSKGLDYIFDGIRWIAAYNVSRRFHAYSQVLYGSLLLRREVIRKRNRLS